MWNSVLGSRVIGYSFPAMPMISHTRIKRLSIMSATSCQAIAGQRRKILKSQPSSKLNLTLQVPVRTRIGALQLRLLFRQDHRTPARLLEVSRNMARPLAVILFVMFRPHLLTALACLSRLPVRAHFLDFLFIVEIGVIMLADASETLPPGQVLGMNGDAVVLGVTAGSEELPPAFLLLEIETGRVG